MFIKFDVEVKYIGKSGSYNKVICSAGEEYDDFEIISKKVFEVGETITVALKKYDDKLVIVAVA